jgi:hypothetical protein
MANSTYPFEVEKRLMFVTALINKLARIGVLTDTLVAAATSFQDLLDDIATALKVSGTSNFAYPEPTRILVRYLLAELAFMNSLGLIDDTITAALLTVRGTSAATDLRYLASAVITVTGFDATDEQYIEAAFGQASYTANLT